MLTKRIIPCLDVRAGRVVKGIRFAGLREVGEPAELARLHAERGADELCLLDVAATSAGTGADPALVAAVARAVFVPITVGGGIRGVAHARALLRAGADKVAVNSAALSDPTCLTALAREFGRQCVVLSIDTLQTAAGYRVTTHGGRRLVEREPLAWATEAVERGAGEVLLNVIDTDGTRTGFALDLTRRLAAALPVPVIASGGAGNAEDFVALFTTTEASAALAASIFHDGTTAPDRLKAELQRHHIPVRP
ncbi:MAG: imidazole glycerol phosphate synthase subunit HisF [Planctomycetes bacterium]|nr:imidazole glycerol phosphate synthase subunit HisF [Planctomycetota bacterium]